MLVTGTDTEVGKTVVTAAVAAAAGAAGLRVAVVKPAQTGIDTGADPDTTGADPDTTVESDVDVVLRLAAPASARALATYPEPLSPLAAAQVAQLPPLALDTALAAVRADAAAYDLVLVEGAGGLLAPMGEGWTLADLAVNLGCPALVVARAGLGTLNHTALTLEALRRRGLSARVVIGAWPAVPELVHLSNLVALAPDLAGVVPDGASGMDCGVFRRSAPGWFTPLLYGSVDDVRQWADPVH
ncbi:MAG TPA: dethiobiotin synthase [Micromonosporaceae bacterium]|nr:dethiobiotin synthase [Micromonosporaceae bacterium]